MKLTGKVAATIAAGALAFSMLGVAGCGPKEEEQAQKEFTTEEIDAQDIEVTDVGFHVFNGDTVSYAFTVNNPNEGYVAKNVTFQIEGYDADGMMVVGGGETIQDVYAGVETGAAGTSFLPEGSAEIDRFEVTPLMEHVNWEKTDLTSDEIANMFTLSNTDVEAFDTSMTVTGDISVDLSTLSDEEDGTADDPNAAPPADARVEAHVVAILKDSDGNIICGASSQGIMLDPSMVNIGGVGPGENASSAEGDTEEPAEGEEGEGEGEEITNSKIARTTFVIDIPGVIDYATCSILATPGL